MDLLGPSEAGEGDVCVTGVQNGRAEAGAGAGTACHGNGDGNWGCCRHSRPAARGEDRRLVGDNRSFIQIRQRVVHRVGG